MYLYICILYRKSYFAYKFPETLDRYEHFFFEKDKHCTTHFQLLNLKARFLFFTIRFLLNVNIYVSTASVIPCENTQKWQMKILKNGNYNWMLCGIQARHKIFPGS